MDIPEEVSDGMQGGDMVMYLERAIVLKLAGLSRGVGPVL